MRVLLSESALRLSPELVRVTVIGRSGSSVRTTMKYTRNFGRRDVFPGYDVGDIVKSGVKCNRCHGIADAI